MQLGVVTERKEQLRAEKDRRDEDLEQVVRQRGLASLEGVTDELQGPAADEEAREEQKACIRELLTADVHELHYSSLDSAIDCLESGVRGRYGNR